VGGERTCISFLGKSNTATAPTYTELASTPVAPSPYLLPPWLFGSIASAGLSSSSHIPPVSSAWSARSWYVCFLFWVNCILLVDAPALARLSARTRYAGTDQWPYVETSSLATRWSRLPSPFCFMRKLFLTDLFLQSALHGASDAEWCSMVSLGARRTPRRSLHRAAARPNCPCSCLAGAISS
jgi:hypothetical protein